VTLEGQTSGDVGAANDNEWRAPTVYGEIACGVRYCRWFSSIANSVVIGICKYRRTSYVTITDL
jgi:hypothetical protein